MYAAAPHGRHRGSRGFLRETKRFSKPASQEFLRYALRIATRVTGQPEVMNRAGGALDPVGSAIGNARSFSELSADALGGLSIGRGGGIPSHLYHPLAPLCSASSSCSMVIDWLRCFMAWAICSPGDQKPYKSVRQVFGPARHERRFCCAPAIGAVRQALLLGRLRAAAARRRGGKWRASPYRGDCHCCVRCKQRCGQRL